MHALRHLLVPIPLSLIVLSACAPNEDMPESPDSPDSPDTPEQVEDAELIAAVEASVQDEAARFELRVTNATESPIEIDFSSGQMYDFIVRTDGRELWRWSEGMMFTQALQSRTLAPGETLRFEERWAPEDPPAGDLVVVGELTSSSHPVRQETRFRFR